MLPLDIELKSPNHRLHWKCLLRKAKHRIVVVTSESISILQLSPSVEVCSFIANMVRKPPQRPRIDSKL